MTDISIGRRTALTSLRPQASTHPGLWLDRYLARQTWRSKDPAPPQGYDKDSAQRAKDDIIQAVTQKDVAQGYTKALDAWRGDLLTQTHRVVCAEGTSLGRVVIGLGAKGAGEFGISLHHTWGVPILPGSSLKGIAALGADRYLDGEQWRRRPAAAQARPVAPTAFDALFGDVEEQGAVIFHDAWFIPSASDHFKNGLHADILTVHHPAYYQGDAEPSDTDSPVPVPFVSASGTFLVALELHPSLDVQEHGHWLTAAWAALRVGLARHGVGSKTNAGYGRLELPAWDNTSIGRHLRHEADKRRLARQEQERNDKQERRKTQRFAMSPLARAQDVMDPGNEGPDALRRWLTTSGEDAIVGLPGTEDQIKAVTTLLCQAGRSKGLEKGDWKPLIQTTIHDEWRRSTAQATSANQPPRTLGPADLQALIDRYTHKKRGVEFNKLVSKLAALGLDEDSLAQAIARLQELGAKPGHLKVLQG